MFELVRNSPSISSVLYFDDWALCNEVVEEEVYEEDVEDVGELFSKRHRQFPALEGLLKGAEEVPEVSADSSPIELGASEEGVQELLSFLEVEVLEEVEVVVVVPGPSPPGRLALNWTMNWTSISKKIQASSPRSWTKNWMIICRTCQMNSQMQQLVKSLF